MFPNTLRWTHNRVQFKSLSTGSSYSNRNSDASLTLQAERSEPICGHLRHRSSTFCPTCSRYFQGLMWHRNFDWLEKWTILNQAREPNNGAFPAERRPTQYSTGHLLIARHTSLLYVGNKNKFDASGFSSEHGLALFLALWRTCAESRTFFRPRQMAFVIYADSDSRDTRRESCLCVCQPLTATNN